MEAPLTIFPVVDQRSDIDIHSENVRDAVNRDLTRALVTSCLTPYIGLERVRVVLAPLHIHLPKYNFMEEQDGAALFDVHQFGEVLGFDTDGMPVERENPDPLYVYFEYAMNPIGTYDVFCEVVNEDEVQELVAEDEIDPENDAIGIDDHHNINHEEHMGHSLKEASIGRLANYIVKAEKDEDQNGANRGKGIKLAKRKFAKGISGKGKVVAGTMNETSQERLKNYIKKAKDTLVPHDRAMQKNAESAKKPSPISKFYGDEFKKHARKQDNRRKGIDKAVDKLNETSQEKVKDYISKAKASNKEKTAGIKFGDKDWSGPVKVMKRKASINKAEKRISEDEDLDWKKVKGPVDQSDDRDHRHEPNDRKPSELKKPPLRRLSETSVERMKKYLPKAKESFNKARDDYDDPKKRDAANHTIGKRNAGIWRVKEKTDHLKETSDERKAAYVDKADKQIQNYNAFATKVRQAAGKLDYKKSPAQEKALKVAMRRSKGIKHVLTKGGDRMHESHDKMMGDSEAAAKAAWQKMKDAQASGNKRAENKAFKEHQKHKDAVSRYRAMGNPLDIKATGFAEQNLQELSKARLQDYESRALKSHTKQVAVAKKSDALASKYATKAVRNPAKANDYRNIENHYDDKTVATNKKIINRIHGLERVKHALKKKTSVDEPAAKSKGWFREQSLMELSKGRIKDYIDAAKGDRKFHSDTADEYEKKRHRALRGNKQTAAAYNRARVNHHEKQLEKRDTGIHKAEKRLDEMSQDRISSYIKGAQKSYHANAISAAEKMIDGQDIGKEKSQILKRLKGIRAANKKGGQDCGI